MSGREWAPGDVALINAMYAEDEPAVAIVTGTPRNLGWAYCGRQSDGNTTQCWTSIEKGVARVVRPLVVIDPEDREQVEALLLGYYTLPFETVRASSIDNMQAALRSLVTPPKPDEPPFKRGTVVMDKKGTEWVRIHPEGKAWVNGWQNWAAWADIDVAEVTP